MAHSGRPTASPRKKRGGGISSIIGGLAGGIEGGGYDPGEEVFMEADFGHEAPPISSRPPSFTPYAVKHPVLDAIFARGAGGAQAMSLNAQQNLTMAQMDAQARATEAANLAAMQREMYAQQQAIERQKLANANAVELAGIGVDAPNLTGSGIPFASRGDWSKRVGSPAVGAAGNLADARLAATSLPGYGQAVANNVFAQQQKLPIEVRAAGAIAAPQNTDIYTPRVGYDMFPNQRISGSSTDQRIEMTGGIPIVGEDGKTTLVGQKPEVVTTRTPGGIVDEDARKQKEDAIRAKLSQVRAAAPQAQTQSSGPEIRATTLDRVKAASSQAVNPAMQEDSNIDPGIIKAIVEFFTKSGGKREGESWNEYYKRTGKLSN